MKHPKIIYTSLFILLIITSILSYVARVQLYDTSTRIAFLDVGQGDAILISEGSYQVLIDGGPDGTILLERLGQQMPFWDRRIEVVIATHPDGDHIDGFIDVFGSMQVQHVLMTQVERENDTFRRLQEVIASSGAQVHEGYAGYTFTFPSGAMMELLYPFGSVDPQHDAPNHVSIAAVVRIGEEVFFLGGDLSVEQEDALPLGTEVTVLKAGHHGSKTSTSDTFLARLQPRDAIISAGRDNHHGHPSPEVVERLERHGVRILRTDTHGTIVYECQHAKQKCVIYTDQVEVGL